MRCRLLNILTALSLLLCVAAAVALWVRSFSWNETVGWYRNEWQGTTLRTTAYGLSSDSGGLLVFGLHRRAQFADEDAAYLACRQINPDATERNYLRQPPAGYPYMAPEYAGWGSLGFGFYSGQRSPPPPLYAGGHPAPSLVTDDRFFVVPYWFLSAITLAAAGRHLLGLQKKPPHLCPRCSYDLRATPGRCPECGTDPVTSRGDRLPPEAAAL